MLILKSRKPAAHMIKSILSSEVLPAIMRSGVYGNINTEADTNEIQNPQKKDCIANWLVKVLDGESFDVDMFEDETDTWFNAENLYQFLNGHRAEITLPEEHTLCKLERVAGSAKGARPEETSRIRSPSAISGSSA